MNLEERIRASAKHAIEVHVSAGLMFGENQWRRTITNEPRDRMIERVLRTTCEILRDEADKRANNPLAHDYNPE